MFLTSTNGPKALTLDDMNLIRCRLCLTTHNTLRIYSIYGLIHGTMVLDLIEQCCGIKIEEDDVLTDICENCLAKLDISRSIQEEFKAADEMLKNLLSEIKVEEIEDNFVEIKTFHPTDIIEKIEELKGEPQEEGTLELKEPEADDQNMFSDGEDCESDWSMSDHEFFTAEDASVYLCHLCPNQYEFNKILAAHLSTVHPSTDKMLCSVCGKLFENRFEIIKHERRHRNGKMSACDVCGKKFTFKNNLQRHQITHTGEKPFQCNFCGKSYNQSTALKQHYMMHNGETPYKCEICGKSYTLNVQLKYHKCLNGKQLRRPVRPHKDTDKTTPEAYTCKFCQGEFPNQSEFIKHLETNHPNHGIVFKQCPQCDEKFLSYKKLLSHSAKHMSKARTKQCSFCSKLFATHTQLLMHENIHKNVKYDCNICGKKMSNPNNLKRHKYTHMEDKPYKCDKCGLSYAQKVCLKKHIPKCT